MCAMVIATRVGGVYERTFPRSCSSELSIIDSRRMVLQGGHETLRPCWHRCASQDTSHTLAGAPLYALLDTHKPWWSGKWCAQLLVCGSGLATCLGQGLRPISDAFNMRLHGRHVFFIHLVISCTLHFDFSHSQACGVEVAVACDHTAHNDEQVSEERNS